MEAAILLSGLETSLGRQEGFGSFWPFRTEIDGHQEKINSIPIRWMLVPLGTGLVRLLEGTFWDQHQLGGSAWVAW